MGRKPKEYNETTAEQVKKLSAIFCTQEEISSIVGVNIKSVIKLYSGKIEEGRNIGKSSIRKKQFDTALAGNISMLIWLGKNYLNQKDNPEMVENANNLKNFLTNMIKNNVTT